MAEAVTPKDAAKRIELKKKLQERMRQSIAEQGAYGVRQTAIWEKAYARAARFCARELPTQATLRKLIKQLDIAHEWKPEQQTED